MATILIIDDEEHIREILEARVEGMGHDPVTAATLKEGLAAVESHMIDLVFLDVFLPDGNGLDALPAIRQSAGRPEVLIITAAGSSQGAEMAINNGAWDYIEKPFYKKELILQIERALEYRGAKRQQSERFLLKTTNIIGRSQALRRSLEEVAVCAASLANVLIQGESGTGKELFARAIHDNSQVNQGKYVVVDCAALPETLIESLLFGHRKGAFTGADRASEGLVRMADGGTLFLDEIGELPLTAQKTFLRVLQEKKFRPVGSSSEVTSRFRLVAATNRDLEAMAAQGLFRTDLLHRLKTVVINLPPLRERQGDIRDLAVHYVDLLCSEHGVAQKALLPDTLELLEGYDWPGNVRELVNCLEKAVLSDPGMPLIYPMHLPAGLRVEAAKKGFQEKPPAGMAAPVPEACGSGDPETGSDEKELPDFKTFRTACLDRIEADYFRRLLAETGWDLDQTAERSNLSKNRVYFFIRKHRLEKP